MDDDSELLKYFESLGLELRDELKILDKAPFQGPITVERKKSEKKLVIGFLAANKIHMTFVELDSAKKTISDSNYILLTEVRIC